MKKHMKKLISTLLAGAMLISSLGVVSFAADTTPAPTSEPTATATPAPTASAAPEATATPEATTAPTATPAPEKTDSYYEEAIGLLTALKIFEGYEDGSFKPETTITRAEMAAVILRTLGTNSTTAYKGTFTDVADTHWAAATIQTAADSGIINGMGDGTFAPDAPVTYEQAVKMVICALNYGAYAEANGGYPTGYLAVANQKDVEVIKNASGTAGEAATRGTVAKMIYNALNALYPTITGFEQGQPKFTTEAGKTLASEKHSVYIQEGVVTATNKVSIDPSATVREGEIVLDGELMKSEIKNGDDLVAHYVKAYYHATNNGEEDKNVLYAFSVASKNDTITLNAEDISEIKDADGTCRIEYYLSTGKTKTLKFVDTPVIVYNDQLLTASNWSRIAADDNTLTLDMFITPTVGSVRAVDFGKDGTYDIMFIDKYETGVVKAATQTKITLEYPVNGISTLDVDTDKNDDMIVTVSRDGEEIKPRNLVKGNVITIKMNANFNDSTFTGDKVITIEGSTKTIEGRVKSKDEDGDAIIRTYAVIDGKKYEVDANCVDDLTKTIGSDATFTLDKFGRIAYVNASSGGKLTGSEQYGWVVNAYTDNEYDNPVVKIYTQDGKFITAEVANKLDFWGPTDKINKTLNMSNNDDAETIKKMRHDSSSYFLSIGDMPVRLCKFKTNSSNQLTRLYVATDASVKKQDESDNSETSAVEVDLTNYNGKNAKGSIFADKYSIKTDMLQFNVPNTTANTSDTEAYSIKTVPTSEFLVTGDKNVSYDFAFGEIDGTTPGISIRYVEGSDDVSKTTYNTADDNPVFMVSKISESVDEDDNTIYTIKGYQDGGEVTYKTTTKTTVNTLAATQNARDYTTTNIWDGKSSKSIADVLKPGDICGVSVSGANANIIIKMVDAEKVVDSILNGQDITESQFFGSWQFSNTRDCISFGAISSIDTDGLAIIKMTNAGTHSMGLDKPITVMEVTVDGNTSTTKVLEDSEDAFELTVFDEETKEGDYAFIREFKGGMREIYIIRFVQK